MKKMLTFTMVFVMMLFCMSAYGQTAHAQIEIDGDADFTAANGVTCLPTCDGTESKPYEINGWSITASGSIGIWVHDTSKHFKIYDCYISNSTSAAVRIEDVSAGTAEIYNMEIGDNDDDGIIIHGSAGADIHDNDIGWFWHGNGGRGMSIESGSCSTKVTDNYIGWNETYGIQVTTNCAVGTKNVFDGNSIYSSYLWNVWISGSTYNDFTSNSINSSIYEDGVYIDNGSSYNHFEDNDINYNDDYGIYITGISTSNTIWKNNFVNNGGTSSQCYDSVGNTWYETSGGCYYGNYYDDHGVGKYGRIFCSGWYTNDYDIDGSAGETDEGARYYAW